MTDDERAAREAELTDCACQVWERTRWKLCPPHGAIAAALARVREEENKACELEVDKIVDTLEGLFDDRTSAALMKLRQAALAIRARRTPGGEG